MNPSEKLSDIKRNIADRQNSSHCRVRIGMATCGISAGADKVYAAFIECAEKLGLDDVDIIPTGCVGRCDLEPLVEITCSGNPPVLYTRVDTDRAKRIVEDHIIGGKVIEEYTENR